MQRVIVSPGAPMTRAFRKNSETIVPVSISGGTLAINLNLGTVFTCTSNANITTFTITGAISGRAHAFALILTGDGNTYNQTWGSSVKWPSGAAPLISTINGAIDAITFTSHNGGTTWLAFGGGQNFL